MSDPTLIADPAVNLGMNIGRFAVFAVGSYIGYRLFFSKDKKE